MDKNIQYENLQKVNLEFEPEFKSRISGFMDTGWYVLGEEVRAFEQNFARYCGAAYCVGVANGLDALQLGIKVFDFPPGAEIIVPSNTYIATILAVINCACIPVLAEPDEQTCNIDPRVIEAKITSRTRAIMPVHLYGQAAKMDDICALADKYNLEIIEDCAQAHGAIFAQQSVGTFGKIGAFSFYPTKNLGALGDAGAIVTSDRNIYEKLKALRNYGSEKKYYNKYLGYNSRLDELQALFLNIKLPSLNKINTYKKRLAMMYNELLSDKVVKPLLLHDRSHVYHIYNIRLPDRDGLRTFLSAHGVQTEIHYPLAPHKQEGYAMYFAAMDFPISDSIHRTTLSLPISYATTEEEVVRVSRLINEYLN
jgi:dTDP-4-amino-4,6-dideoxygalactose transaminase